MLINAVDSEESRIATVRDGVLQELHVEITSREAYLGNIYKGRVVNIEPSIGAAFVSFGGTSVRVTVGRLAGTHHTAM